MNENERSQQEYEFIMEGITTRMQIAKAAEVKNLQAMFAEK